jgi:uncharacterized protein
MGARFLVWTVEATRGFDSAWVTLDGDRLTAEGQAAALIPQPYSLSYRLETDDACITTRMQVSARWDGGSAELDLRHDDAGWTVNGERRPDLDGALDCDLQACPLTNVMPIRRHGLHRAPGEHEFVMAYIDVPTLKVDTSPQHYTHLRRTDDGGALVGYSSGDFSSDLTVDADGLVIEYPRLARRLEPR